MRWGDAEGDHRTRSQPRALGASGVCRERRERATDPADENLPRWRAGSTPGAQGVRGRGRDRRSEDRRLLHGRQAPSISGWYVTPLRQPGTIRGYATIVRRIKEGTAGTKDQPELLGNIRLDKLTPGHLDRAYAARLGGCL
jgi:hypothetical protein